MAVLCVGVCAFGGRASLEVKRPYACQYILSNITRRANGPRLARRANGPRLVHCTNGLRLVHCTNGLWLVHRRNGLCRNGLQQWVLQERAAVMGAAGTGCSNGCCMNGLQGWVLQ